MLHVQHRPVQLCSFKPIMIWWYDPVNYFQVKKNSMTTFFFFLQNNKSVSTVHKCNVWSLSCLPCEGSMCACFVLFIFQCIKGTGSRDISPHQMTPTWSSFLSLEPFRTWRWIRLGIGMRRRSCGESTFLCMYIKLRAESSMDCQGLGSSIITH